MRVIFRIIIICAINTVSITAYGQVELPDIPVCELNIETRNIDSLVLTSYKIYKSNPEKSFCLLLQAKKYSNTTTDKEKVAKNANEISDFFLKENNFKETINFLSIAKNIWFELNASKDYTSSLLVLANCYYKTGDFYTSTKLSNIALDLSRKNNFKEQEYYSLQRLFWNHWRINDLDKSLEFVNLSKKLVDNGDVQFSLIDYYYYLAHIDKARSLYQDAIENISLTYELAIKEKDSNMIALALSNKANYLLHKQGDFKEILKLNLEALSINKQMNDIEQLGSNYGLLCMAYVYGKQYDKAIEVGLIGLNYAKQFGFPIRIKGNYSLLKDAYSKNGDYENAYYYAEQERLLIDQVYGLKKVNKFFELQQKYESEQSKNVISNLENEKQISELKNKQSKQLFWLFLIIGILLFSGVLSFFIRNRVAQKRKNEALKVKLSNELMQMEMEALRARMNPHFLFNSLNSIKNYIVKNDSRKASDYLTKFATLVRMILNHSKEKTISLNEELKAISYYIEIEKMRLKDKFDYNLKVDEKIDLDEIKIPPSILQPFVENAIWHGFMGSTKKGLLSINVSQNDDKIIIEIQDNGIGRKEAEKLKLKKGNHKSTGLKIIDKTIEVYKEREILDLEIKIIDLFSDDNKPNGTKICIAIKN